ncbi:hypothetical protein GGR56DRAFT_661790 [Xylariaceae sp. FL0804]|nr:hypothetical protein GGR56DRAFT_661790 [Xylariaceae sp. FL0804]
MPPRDRSSSTPQRKSCDRCHDLKLRCVRSGNSDTTACDRCLRKQAPCVYSSSLPKGRPSLYRTSVSSVSRRVTAQGLSTLPMDANATDPTATTIPPDALALGTSASVLQAHTTQHDVSKSRPSSSSPVEGSTGAPTETEDSAHSRTDAELGKTGTGNLISSFDDLTGLWGRWPITDATMNAGIHAMNTEWNMDWDPSLEPQFSVGASSGSFSNDPTGMTAENHLAQSRISGSMAGQVFEGHTTPPDDDGLDSPASSGDICTTAGKPDFGLGITHLSRLSMRLSRLIQLKSSLVEKNHRLQGISPGCDAQPAVEGMFKRLNAWLLDGSSATDSGPDAGWTAESATPGDLLHEVFASTNHLQHILAYLAQNGCAAQAARPSSGHGSSSSRSSEASLELVTPPPLQHLLVACVIQVLNIYTSILVALQRNAQTLTSPLAEAGLEPRDNLDSASRGHIQLVSVVQMCSYFISRLSDSIDALPLDKWMSSTSSLSEATCSRAVQEMRKLKTEVTQRVKQLQVNLRIGT